MKIAMLAIPLALIAATADAAQKAQPLPADLPPYGPTQAFTPPAVTELKLANGLTVWLAPESGFPKVAFTLAVKGGYAADPKERPGIAELLASAVPEGTVKSNARQIAEAIQNCGGDLSVRAGADTIRLQTEALSEKADAALSVIADVVQNAAFSDPEVEIAKKTAASTLQAQEAEPSFLGRRALRRAIFGEHPYSVSSPTMPVIEQTTAAELRNEFKRRFRPNHAVLVAVGDFDAKQLAAAIHRDFDGWKADSTENLETPPAPPASVTRTVVYVPRGDSVQTAFFLGALTPTLASAEHEPVEIANAIYGGMFGSRLVVNIREDKGYTYSPYSYIVSFAGTGLLTTSASVRNEVTGPSFNEIGYELNRLATTTPDKDELEHAKRYLIGNMTIRLQAHASLAGTLAEYWGDGLTPGDLAREGEKIEHVSLADVQTAGERYFPMSRMTVVAVGDEKVIRQQLAPFGVELSKAQ